MSCNLEVVTCLTRSQVERFVDDKRMVGGTNSREKEGPIMDYIGNYMKQMTGYAGEPIVCVSRVAGEDAGLNLGVDCYLPTLPLKTGNFLLQVKTCNDSVCSLEMNEYFRLRDEFKEAQGADDLEFLSEELYDIMQLGGITEADSVVSFVPFLDGSSLQYFTLLGPDWSQSSQSVEFGVEAIKLRIMNLVQ